MECGLAGVGSGVASGGAMGCSMAAMDCSGIGLSTLTRRVTKSDAFSCNRIGKLIRGLAVLVTRTLRNNGAIAVSNLKAFSMATQPGHRIRSPLGVHTRSVGLGKVNFGPDPGLGRELEDVRFAEVG